MIKKLFMAAILCVLSSLTLSAQYADRSEQFYRKGGHIYTSDGTRIERSAALNYMSADTYADYYLRGTRLFASGIVVSSVGAGVLVGSVVFDLVNSSLQTVDPAKPTQYVPVVTMIGGIVGGAMLLASVPLYAVGAVRLNRAAEQCGPQGLACAPELSFVSRTGGLGLVIDF